MSYRVISGIGSELAAERLKAKRRANAKIPSRRKKSRQVERREIISSLKEMRHDLKMEAAKSSRKGGAAIITHNDVRDELQNHR